MYVIFPAEEVIDFTLGLSPHSSPCNHQTTPITQCSGPVHCLYCLQQEAHVHHPHQHQHQHSHHAFCVSSEEHVNGPTQPESNKRTKTKTKEKKKEKERVKERKTKSRKQQKKDQTALGIGPQGEQLRDLRRVVTMATGEVTLREITHPSLNEALKQHNSVTFKLVRTVSDFTQQLSQVYEQHAEALQVLVANFRKRNAELRKERPVCPSALFHTWETLLQEVEVDSQTHSDIASVLGRQVSRPLLERSFHRKIQSRKVFTHRESYETILIKTEEKLMKCRQDYKTAYLSYLGVPSTVTLSGYLNAHNEYVCQLHATNGMLERYHHEALPQLLQELEGVYSDLCTTLSESLQQGAEVISSRAVEQSRRYGGLSAQCRAVAGPQDLAHFVRSLPQPQGPQRPALRHNFSPPQPPPPQELADGSDADGTTHHNNATTNPPPLLKNEIVVDRLTSVSARSRYEALRKEAADLETHMKQLQDSLDTLLRIQQRSLESSLFNKANELQEDISMKRFDIRVAHIHLGAVQAQKELFASKTDATSDTIRERKMSSSSTGSMKSKWLKAFKSLKTTSNAGNGGGATMREADKRNGKERETSQQPPDASAHMFQEYTYKKITPCDACSQVLRGHTRQGLKCRNCKLNVHVDCQEKLSRCQPKSRLLRRQKSTSEIETRLPEPAEEENGLKALGDVAGAGLGAGLGSCSPLPPDTYRRRRLFAGMKSMSMFGGRGRENSPAHSRSISLPESRSPGSGVGTRPFGQPLCLSETINENGCVTPATSTNPITPIKSKTNRYSK